jgi:SagB-type dehydrogenase family enzyme
VIAQPSLRSVVYGDEEVDLDDPAERYHEASKLYPALAARQTAGIVQLAGSATLQAVSAHAVKRNLQLPTVPLPPALHPRTSLWLAIERRRSSRAFEGSPLRLQALATLLDAGYGTVAPTRRAVPSGGALYPLELFVFARRVEGLTATVCHFDPERRVLEVLCERDVSAELDAASAFPGLLDRAAAAVFVGAVFWRTRFKYGQRGYRFALLEAGHVMQNILLAATALGVPALPLGGFYDDRVDTLLGLNGVDESALYGVVLGGEQR